MTTIHIEVEPFYVDQIIAYLQSLPADKRGKIMVENKDGVHSYLNSWEQYKEERSRQLASLSTEEAWKELYGKE